MEYALHFGGDYELLLVLPPDQFPVAQRSIASLGTSLVQIGKATEDTVITLSDKDSKVPLTNKGYDHFKPVWFP